VRALLASCNGLCLQLDEASFEWMLRVARPTEAGVEYSEWRCEVCCSGCSACEGAGAFVERVIEGCQK
jgi:hypothetical protein